VQQHRSGGKGEEREGKPASHHTPLCNTPTYNPLPHHAPHPHHTQRERSEGKGREKGKGKKGKKGKGRGKREEGKGKEGVEKEKEQEEKKERRKERRGRGERGPFVCGLGMMCGVDVGCEWMFCRVGLCSVTRVREKEGKK